MLTLNGLAGIRPLQSREDTARLRTRAPVKMDWEIDVSMEWSTQDLKYAAAVNPRNEKVKMDDMNNRIDEFLRGMTKEERKNVTPLDITTMLVDSEALEGGEQYITQIDSCSQTNRTAGVGCEGCQIMQALPDSPRGYSKDSRLLRLLDVKPAQ